MENFNTTSQIDVSNGRQSSEVKVRIWGQITDYIHCFLLFLFCGTLFYHKKIDYGSISWEGAILVPPPQKRDHFYTKTGLKRYPTGAEIIPL